MEVRDVTTLGIPMENLNGCKCSPLRSIRVFTHAINRKWKKKRIWETTKLLTKKHVYMIKKNKFTWQKKHLHFYLRQHPYQGSVGAQAKKNPSSTTEPCGLTREAEANAEGELRQPLFQAYFFFNKDTPTPYKHERNLLPDTVRCNSLRNTN